MMESWVTWKPPNSFHVFKNFQADCVGGKECQGTSLSFLFVFVTTSSFMITNSRLATLFLKERSHSSRTLLC